MGAFQEMTGSIMAEESLRTAAATALGSGNMKKSDARSLQRRWERAAKKGEVVSNRPAKASPAILAGIGLGMAGSKRDA